MLRIKNKNSTISNAIVSGDSITYLTDILFPVPICLYHIHIHIYFRNQYLQFKLGSMQFINSISKYFPNLFFCQFLHSGKGIALTKFAKHRNRFDPLVE